MAKNSHSWVDRLFNGTNDFGKLIVKELVDMREAVIKAFVRCNRINLRSENRWRRFNDILNDISDEIKNKL